MINFSHKMKRKMPEVKGTETWLCENYKKNHLYRWFFTLFNIESIIIFLY
jgi:hypothetical protein